MDSPPGNRTYSLSFCPIFCTLVPDRLINPMRGRDMSTLIHVICLFALVMVADDEPHPSSKGQRSTHDFIALMRIVAEGWNEGNARKASDCFTEDAVYLEPPNRQLYVGRRAIDDFFGRPTKPQPPMRMEWHHLAFNEREQVG